MSVPAEAATLLLERIPSEILSPISREFTARLLEANQDLIARHLEANL